MNRHVASVVLLPEDYEDLYTAARSLRRFLAVFCVVFTLFAISSAMEHDWLAVALNAVIAVLTAWSCRSVHLMLIRHTSHEVCVEHQS